MAVIAILGGTGPEGIGLAMRFAQVGEEIVIGSREASRAEAAAQRVAAAVAGARVSAAENAAAAAKGEIIVLALPHVGVEAFLATDAAALSGKITVDVTVPLRFKAGVCIGVDVPEGSLGERIQHLAPQARVVSAFKNLSAEHLQHLDTALEGDVLVCGGDAAAKAEIQRLAGRLPNLRAVDAGPLSSARALEQITVMLLNINRIHHALTSVRVLGLRTED